MAPLTVEDVREAATDSGSIARQREPGEPSRRYAAMTREHRLASWALRRSSSKPAFWNPRAKSMNVRLRLNNQMTRQIFWRLPRILGWLGWKHRPATWKRPHNMQKIRWT